MKSPTCHLLSGLQLHLFVLLEALAGEAEEDQHDAEVHDVAAVAALVAATRPIERREESVPVAPCRTLAPRQNSCAIVPTTNALKREADARGPDAHAERDDGAAGDERARATGHRN